MVNKQEFWKHVNTRRVLYLCRTPRACACRNNINIEHAVPRKNVAVNTPHRDRPRNNHKPAKTSVLRHLY